MLAKFWLVAFSMQLSELRFCVYWQYMRLSNFLSDALFEFRALVGFIYSSTDTESVMGLGAHEVRYR